MQAFLATRKNDLLRLPESVTLTTDLSGVQEAETVIISVNSQGLQALMDEMAPMNLRQKTFVLCMKGIEIGTGRRLSQIAAETGFCDASHLIRVFREGMGVTPEQWRKGAWEEASLQAAAGGPA